MKQIDVSVPMMTYFHEKYISQAIDSVLSQITTFSYEIVISDDCSTDRTREILLQYKNRYPDIIKLNFNETNMGISMNNYLTRSLCKGRYIIPLSGDDYWIDNTKLQKQVEFMDSHPEFFSSVTSVEARYDDDTAPFLISPQKKYRGKVITLEMYLQGATICTHGLIMRNAYLTKEGRDYFSLVYKASKYVDDSTECILMLKKSPIFSMDICTVAYRVHRSKKGNNNYNSSNSVITHVKKMVDLYNYLDREFKGNINFFNLYKKNMAKIIPYSLLRGCVKDMHGIYLSIPDHYKKRNLMARSCINSVVVIINALYRKIRK